MDVYIAMCDCKELQGLWEPKRGDKFVFKSEVDIVPDDWSERMVPEDILTWVTEEWDYYKSYHGLWLPRQEDIQEMLFKAPEYWTSPMNERINFYPMVCDLFNYLRGTLSGVVGEEPTPDQCWLMFYMDMVHNKHWRDGGWQTGGTP